VQEFRGKRGFRLKGTTLCFMAKGKEESINIAGSAPEAEEHPLKLSKVSSVLSTGEKMWPRNAPGPKIRRKTATR